MGRRAVLALILTAALVGCVGSTYEFNLSLTVDDVPTVWCADDKPGTAANAADSAERFCMRYASASFDVHAVRHCAVLLLQKYCDAVTALADGASDHVSE